MTRQVKIFTVVLVLLVTCGCAAILGLGSAARPEPAVEPRSESGTLELSFIDVGQGDATLIHLPDETWLLVDGGPQASVATLLAALRSSGVERIDYLVATHPHEDHIGGLDDVIDSFSVGRIYMPRISHTTQAFENLLTSIARSGNTVTTAKAGVIIAEGPDFSVEVVSPPEGGYENINDASAVLKVTHGDVSFLLCGDITANAENRLRTDVDVDVLRIAHHGSKSSTTEAFLRRTTPSHAVISVGRGNSYGHPNGAVLSRLESSGVAVYRTDLSGTIRAVSDGAGVTFEQTPRPR